MSLVIVYTITFSGIIAIPVIFQVASLLAALVHPGNIVCYAPGDSLPCRRDALEIHRVYMSLCTRALMKAQRLMYMQFFISG
ncbi:hypothetical protein EAE90_16540 [Photorhabdus caribbeanensis]|nr:hypothetical protein [Photorhabdus caribbeanensis]